MRQFYFGILLSLFWGNSFYAQEILPKGLTQEEQGLISSYEFSGTQLTPAPELPVRTAAQWEEVEYLVLGWSSQFQNIQRQIVEAAIEECKVLIATQDRKSVV